MDHVTFSVGRQKYVAQLELDEEHVSVTMSVGKSGDDQSLLDISWNPKTKWELFQGYEEGVSIGVAKRALKIWEDYRKTAASKALHKHKPKPAPKALQVLRKQLNEAMDKGEHERADTLIAECRRHIAKTRVLLPLG